MGVLNNPDNIAIPSRVKAYGRYLLCCPRPFFKVKKLHLKESCSSLVSINMKSSGKRSMFIRTARFKFFVVDKNTT